MKPGLLVLCASILLAGCASRNDSATATTSLQIVQYYPFQVKGYENSYPRRRVIALRSTDVRPPEVTTVAGPPLDGNPPIGVVVNDHGQVTERLYGPPLDRLVQDALAKAADEAGMQASAFSLPLETELKARNADYVISSKILRCWIIKKIREDSREGPSSASVAEVALDIAIYKPPFRVPFWQGQSTATYMDPPPAISGGLEDQTEIYDQPGEVLSVALTRAVAGLFKRDDLRVLIQQDNAVTAH